MASIIITIPLPVLTGSEVFLAKYKLKTSSVWTNVSPNPTNAPFTLTGLATGEYELQVAISDQPNCAVVQECFTINTTCNCPTVSNQQFTTVNQLNYISFDLDFTTSGFPPCGLVIILQDTSAGTSTILNITDESMLILISAGHFTFKKQVTDTSYEVSLYINCCVNEPTLCGQPFYIVQNTPSPPACVPPLYVFYLSGLAWKDTASGNWYMHVYVKTTCDMLTINYQEIFTYLTPDSGSNVISGILSLPINPSGYREVVVQVHPNADDYGGQKYQGSVYDCCGKSFTFTY